MFLSTYILLTVRKNIRIATNFKPILIFCFKETVTIYIYFHIHHLTLQNVLALPYLTLLCLALNYLILTCLALPHVTYLGDTILLYWFYRVIYYYFYSYHFMILRWLHSVRNSEFKIFSGSNYFKVVLCATFIAKIGL